MESAYIDYKNWCFIVERELGRKFTDDEAALVRRMGEVDISVAGAIAVLKYAKGRFTDVKQH